MEVLFAIPIILIPLFFPLVAGLMAQSLGRSFWFWFWISFLIPFVSCIILLCLPVGRHRAMQVAAQFDKK